MSNLGASAQGWSHTQYNTNTETVFRETVVVLLCLREFDRVCFPTPVVTEADHRTCPSFRAAELSAWEYWNCRVAVNSLIYENWEVVARQLYLHYLQLCNCRALILINLLQLACLSLTTNFVFVSLTADLLTSQETLTRSLNHWARQSDNMTNCVSSSGGRGWESNAMRWEREIISLYLIRHELWLWFSNDNHGKYLLSPSQSELRRDLNICSLLSLIRSDTQPCLPVCLADWPDDY